MKLSKRYRLEIDPDALVSDITVGMQQRVEILKMLYRKNEILIFDEPTAVLTPQETIELMKIMKSLTAEGNSILFITHKLGEIKAVANRCTVLRKGKYIGTVDVASKSKEELSEMMVGRMVNLSIKKGERQPGKIILKAENITVKNKTHGKAIVNNVSFKVCSGEIVSIAGIDGNGQQELVFALTGMLPPDSGRIILEGKEITHNDIRSRNISHIPEDRQKHGLVPDYNLAYNFILQNYFSSRFQKNGFLKYNEIYSFADNLIKKFDIRSGHGVYTMARNMSGGNQQKAIIARELSRDSKLLIAVQPTRGLDVGACEYIHKQLIAERDKGRGVLLVSFELDEVISISDRILVIFEGKIAANVRPREVSFKELGLFMSGAAGVKKT
jgi:simple sugar transport system ATP-binding protein